MNWKTEKHFSRPLNAGVELVEYRCDCLKGFYRVTLEEPRIEVHDQIPHKCNVCGKLAYFVTPYPVVSVNGKRFVHWDTIRCIPKGK
ncbi:conserved hypothetical protein [Vibrio nigripulchritudo SOn1]|uniref:Uncharacterized protein n=1 Tax=Vibrio nigripulchritudo SOn1 TaxID=1238450 RepID=A0AAV2VPW6_9VIBR|nr:hypothetical protein [Vibrio nigripulchritudo]CCO46716.1 conserved hypothetical protein [Vibrio nigripulchritudo SOn1]